MTTPEASQPTVLARLRMATRPLHDELEQLVESDRLLTGSPDRAHYRRLLMAQGALHRMVARHTDRDVLGARARFLDWPGCHRLAALDLDLRALGETSLLQSDPLPLTQGLPTPPEARRAYAAGLLYVIEGSAHGNAVMLKTLRQSTEFRSWDAERFLATSREGLQRRWAETLEVLMTYGDPEPDHAVAGAVRGFRAFGEFWRAGDGSPRSPQG